MCTCHANTPLDSLRRIESLSLIGAPAALPSLAVRAQIASAIDIIVCCNRFPDGARKVTAISEVLPLDAAGEYRTQDLFVYAPVRREPDGTLVGYHAPTGIVADFAEEARAFGYGDLTEEFFDPATYDLPAPSVSRADPGHVVRWAPSLRHREKGLPDPEALKANRSTWEAALSTSQPRVPPPTPIGAPRLVTSEQAPGPFRTGSGGRGNLEVVPLSELEPAATGSEPKVELSPDLVAELDKLGVSLEVTPASAPEDKAVPAVPKKGA
jgi:pilus assembly protein CpaF